jgi:hypothetical protein
MLSLCFDHQRYNKEVLAGEGLRSSVQHAATADPFLYDRALPGYRGSRRASRRARPIDSR